MSIQTVVVGYGKALNTKLFHCNAIQQTEGLTLYGICARRLESQEEVRRLYGAKVYLSFEEVLKDQQVDLVVITTPSYLHADMATRALNAGKHVVVEKPMCLKAPEGDAMIQASQRQGCLLSVRNNRRWDSDFLTVKKVISDGTLGSVFLLQLAYTDILKPTGWRAKRARGGGVLYDLGSHLIDQALQLFTVRPKTVCATIGNWVWETESETYARVMLGFENGAMADIELSHISWIPRPRWYVLGDQGSLIYEKGKFRFCSNSGEVDVEQVPGREGDFYRNIAQALHGKEKLMITPEEARNVIRIIEAAFLSAKSGKVIAL